MEAVLSKYLFIFLFFNTLNALLVLICPSVDLRRDVLVSAVGFVALLVFLRNPKNDNYQIHKSKQFRRLFPILTIAEVLFTLVLPWWLITGKFRRTSNPNDEEVLGSLLAPHLFVLQEQIALEGIIMTYGNRPKLVLDYTCGANLYRSLAIYSWLSGSLRSETASPLVTGLSIVAGLLWVCSNSFILFVWYPCLQKQLQGPKKKL